VSANLKAAPGREILVFGSRTMRNDLLSAGHAEREGQPSDHNASCSPLPPSRSVGRHTVLVKARIVSRSG
jgi:hypothetical protein